MNPHHLFLLVAFFLPFQFQNPSGTTQPPKPPKIEIIELYKKKIEGPLTAKLLTEGEWMIYTPTTQLQPIDGFPLRFSEDGTVSTVNTYRYCHWHITDDGKLEIFNREKRVEKLLDYNEAEKVLFSGSQHPFSDNEIVIGQHRTDFNAVIKRIYPKKK